MTDESLPSGAMKVAEEWLLAEVPNIDYSPSKGTWAVSIYKAMIAARASAGEAQS